MDSRLFKYFSTTTENSILKELQARANTQTTHLVHSVCWTVWSTSSSLTTQVTIECARRVEQAPCPWCWKRAPLQSFLDRRMCRRCWQQNQRPTRQESSLVFLAVVSVPQNMLECQLRVSPELGSLMTRWLSWSWSFVSSLQPSDATLLVAIFAGKWDEVWRGLQVYQTSSCCEILSAMPCEGAWWGLPKQFCFQEAATGLITAVNSWSVSARHSPSSCKCQRPVNTLGNMSEKRKLTCGGKREKKDN